MKACLIDVLILYFSERGDLKIALEEEDQHGKAKCMTFLQDYALINYGAKVQFEAKGEK